MLVTHRQGELVVRLGDKGGRKRGREGRRVIMSTCTTQNTTGYVQARKSFDMLVTHGQSELVVRLEGGREGGREGRKGGEGVS